MSLRIPLGVDQTTQVEFHEIERRLRKLERAVGQAAGNTTVRVIGSGNGSAGVNLQPLLDRITALENAVAGLGGSDDLPELGPVGSEAQAGIAPDPGIAEPPTGVAQHLLTEDATWGFPLRGLVGVETSGEQTEPPYDVVNLNAALHAGHMSTSNMECFNLHIHGDVLYEDSYFEDLRFPVQGINPAGTASPPSIDTTDPYAGTLLFSASVTNVIAGIAQIPHSWKQGTPISPHIHWAPTSTGAGNVAWRFSYQLAEINAAFPGTLTTAGIELDAADGTSGKHQLHAFTDIDTTGVSSVSMCIVWKLERVGGDGSDDYADAARLLELDFHYERDSPGSRELYQK
jgi:hypothetical protein